MSKLMRGHVGGELKDNFDEDVEVVVDVIVVGKDDTSTVIPTETEIHTVDEDAHDVQLEWSCG